MRSDESAIVGRTSLLHAGGRCWGSVIPVTHAAPNDRNRPQNQAIFVVRTLLLGYLPPHGLRMFSGAVLFRGGFSEASICTCGGDSHFTLNVGRGRGTGHGDL